MWEVEFSDAGGGEEEEEEGVVVVAAVLAAFLVGRVEAAADEFFRFGAILCFI